MTKPNRRSRQDPWTPKRKGKPTSRPRPRAPPPTHFTCRICIEEQTTDQFPRWVVKPKRYPWQTPTDVPLNCIPHLARNPRKKKDDPVCKTCIGAAMSARLDTLGARKVGAGCLEPGCTQLWDHDFVMRYFPRGEPLEKFNMEMFKVWFEDTAPKPMTCPSPTCNAVGLPDALSFDYPHVTCHACSFRSCAICLVPWHKGITCTEYSAKHIDERMSNPEKDTLKLMQTKDAKRCPNCYFVIEKDGGCDSVFCTGCRKYFQWTKAASAVLGAKKAEPFKPLTPWHKDAGLGVCEMDRIEGKTGDAGASTVVAAAS